MGGDSEHFPVMMGLHQGSTISPFLFMLVMDVLTQQIQGEASGCMLFTNDIEYWLTRLAMELTMVEGFGDKPWSLKGLGWARLKLNIWSVSYVEAWCSSHLQERMVQVYGSLTQGDREINNDVTQCSGVGWENWEMRFASTVFCDNKIWLKHKEKFYRVVIRPIMLYGVKCWPIKNSHFRRWKM